MNEVDDKSEEKGKFDLISYIIFYNALMYILTFGYQMLSIIIFYN